MPIQIHEDHKRFWDIISDRARRDLKKFISSGKIVGSRPNGRKIVIPSPRITIPHLVHGDSNKGYGQGEGKEGDILRPGKNNGNSPGKGKGGDQNDQHDDMHIAFDLDEVLQFMQDELKLPEMKPKQGGTFKETKIKYNDITKVGLRALRHNKRTIKESLKRMAATGQLQNKKMVPSSDVPMNVLNIENSDLRFRQYNEIQIPSSDAVIFFARDCSGSITDEHRQIITNMSWWINCWIKKFYNNVQKSYVIHDFTAEEVSEEKFYTRMSYNGTRTSSAFKKISELIENKFSPQKYNIYVFYFTDGDNWGDDTHIVSDMLKSNFGPDVANLVGITQIMPYGGELYAHLSQEADKFSNMRLLNITRDQGDVDKQVLEGIKHILSPA